MLWSVAPPVRAETVHGWRCRPLMRARAGGITDGSVGGMTVACANALDSLDAVGYVARDGARVLLTRGVQDLAVRGGPR